MLIAVQSAAFAISSPTRQAIIPRARAARRDPAANTLSYTIVQRGAWWPARWPPACSIGAGGSVFWAYAVDALAFTVALWATLRLPPILPTGEGTSSDRKGGWVRT